MPDFKKQEKVEIQLLLLPKEGTLGKLQAGFLEKSNTDITDEIILMLRTQQAFNGCSKMMQSDIDVTKKLSAR